MAKIDMTRNAWRRAMALVVMLALGSMHASAQGLVDRARMLTDRGPASFEVWAHQRSNAITSATLDAFYTGGFLTSDFLNRVLADHPQMATAGLEVGWSKRWSTRPFIKDQWSLTWSVGSDILTRAQWRQDLFALTFIGNAPSVGRQMALSGTGVRLGAFNRVSVGLEQAKSRQRIELSLVQRVAGAEWGIPYGTFLVSEGVDSMEVVMQTYASASVDNLPQDGGFSFGQIMPAYGFGVSGSLPLISDNRPLQLELEFRDVGVLWEPSGGQFAMVDTSLFTTGLPIPIAAYLDDNYVADPGLTIQNVLDGNTGYEDVLFHTDSAVGRVLMLPSRLNAKLSYWPYDEFMMKAAVRAGNWMPQPELTMGVGWMPDARFAFGLDFRTGGWGQSRPALWLDWRITKKRILSLDIDDPLGFMWRQDMAAYTYGRGFHLTLRRIPGEDKWTRLMGLDRARAFGQSGRRPGPSNRNM